MYLSIIQIANNFLIKKKTQIIQIRSYPFGPPQNSITMDNWFCNKISNITRNEDICSHYLFGDNSVCRVSTNVLNKSLVTKITLKKKSLNKLLSF